MLVVTVVLVIIAVLIVAEVAVVIVADSVNDVGVVPAVPVVNSVVISDIGLVFCADIEEIGGLVISEECSVDAFDFVAVNVFVIFDIVSDATCVNFVIYFVSFNSIGVTWVDIRFSDVFVCV